MDTREMLDQICYSARTAELKNALHACREGHPWNKTAVKPWTNAAMMASGHFEVSLEQVRWLWEKAKEIEGDK